MMSLVLRLATEHDIPSLKQLIPESARALSTGHYIDRQTESAIVHIFGLDSQLIADDSYYAVVADNHIVGCGGWSKRKTLYGGNQMKGEVDDLLDPTHDAARIRAFFELVSKSEARRLQLLRGAHATPWRSTWKSHCHPPRRAP